MGDARLLNYHFFEQQQRIYPLNLLALLQNSSGNPWKPSQLFIYLSVQIETGNYKLIFELQLRHFIKWSNQLQETIKFSVIFDFSLLERRVVKNRSRDFLLSFYFSR